MHSAVILRDRSGSVQEFLVPDGGTLNDVEARFKIENNYPQARPKNQKTEDSELYCYAIDSCAAALQSFDEKDDFCTEQSSLVVALETL